MRDNNNNGRPRGKKNDRVNHDIKNAVLLFKQLAELFESGFSPTETERADIVSQLKKSYELLQKEIL